MEVDQYQHQSECEDYVDYAVEGYHPVYLGQKFNAVYTVIQKLGWGHFSTVWLVQKQSSKQYVALKIQRSKESHTESAIDELEMLTEIQKHQSDQQWIQILAQYEKMYPKMFSSKLCRPLLLLDNFVHYGIHGKHMCTVFELMGPNLLDVIQHYEFKEKRMPLWLVKKITRDVLMGLVYLHEHCKVIHTDLKPQNIMIKMEPYEEQQLIEQLKNYKVKPISMKYLKNLTAAKNPKNKKKQEKKKLKKKKQQENQEAEEEDSEIKNDPELLGQQEGVSEVSSETARKQNEVFNSMVEESSSLASSTPLNKQISSSLNNVSSSSSNIAEPSSSSPSKIESLEPKKGEEKEDNQWQDIQDGVDMGLLIWKDVKIRLNDKLFFKIADMGNACFTHKHYTEDIQTRQYRSPEVLLGYDYYCNTDIFSLACVVFEMLTNNFLFKPKKISGIKKNQDHIFQMLETLGPMEKEYAINGKNSGDLFNKKGKLLNGNPKGIVPISRLLVEKYDYDPLVAAAVEEFLLPMLVYEPKLRIDAKTCLKSSWLWK